MLLLVRRWPVELGSSGNRDRGNRAVRRAYPGHRGVRRPHRLRAISPDGVADSRVLYADWPGFLRGGAADREPDLRSRPVPRRAAWLGGNRAVGRVAGDRRTARQAGIATSQPSMPPAASREPTV